VNERKLISLAFSGESRAWRAFIHKLSGAATDEADTGEADAEQGQAGRLGHESAGQLRLIGT
jgi:hypothetical protein